MMTFKSYAAFVHVIEQGNFSAAARAMGVPRPTLSRWISELEAHLGVDLLHRSGKSMTPTRSGQVFFERIRPLMDAFEGAEQEIRQMDGVPRGHLRVSISPAAASVLASALSAYTQAHPEVQMDVWSTNEHIDLRKHQVDVAIRGGVLTDSDLICRRLMRVDAIAVASPKYIQRAGLPQTPEELADHRCLLGYGHHLTPQRHWPLRNGDHVVVPNSFCSNDRYLLWRMAMAGQGIALLSDAVIGDAIETGKLMPVLHDVLGVTVGIYAVYAKQAHLPPRIRTFVDEMVQFCAPWSEGYSPL